MSKKTNIGIIGLGYVGGAVRHWFELDENRDKFDLFFYDKYKNIGSIQEVNKADIIFIAVPTPFYDKASTCTELHADPPKGEEKRGLPRGERKRTLRGYDDSAVYDAVSNVEDLPAQAGGKIVIIKSSVLPGTTDKLQEENPNKTLLFNPEFLTAKNATNDFVNAERQIIGYTNEESRKAAEVVINILPRAEFTKIIKAREAEMVKFFGNTFLSMRVIFANQMYDFCQKLGIDYESVMECAGRDTRIGHSHFDVFHEGYRGYGGMCFPKDVKSLLELSLKLGVDLELLKKMDEINEELRKPKNSPTGL